MSNLRNYEKIKLWDVQVRYLVWAATWNEYKSNNPPHHLLSALPLSCCLKGLEALQQIIFSPLVCSDLTWPDLRQTPKKKASLPPLASDLIVLCHNMTIHAHNLFSEETESIVSYKFIYLLNARVSLKCCYNLPKLSMTLLEKEQSLLCYEALEFCPLLMVLHGTSEKPFNSLVSV